MINPLFRRYFVLRKPLVSLNQHQELALDRFRTKLGQDYYAFEQASCLCGELDGQLISKRDRYALYVDTYLCKACGMMWTTPRMTLNSLMKFYEEDYRPIYVGQAQAPDDFFIDQTRNGEVVLGFVTSNIHFPRKPVVFDVGCGAGGVLLPFANAGWKGFGCDVGQEYLQRGRSAGLILEHGSRAALQKYAPANLVILSHVLEHLPSPLDELQRLRELLADDGYVYVEVPGIFSMHRTYGDTLLYLQNAHLYHFTLATLSSIMARAGYKLLVGDEYIHAIFKKVEHVSPILTADQYRKVLCYLYGNELRRWIRDGRFLRRARHVMMKCARRSIGDNSVDKIKKTLNWPEA